MRRLAAPLMLLWAIPLACAARPPDAVALGRIDDIVKEEIAASRLPGAVVLVGGESSVYYRRAFGERQVKPERLPMTEDTIFDLASLTKPVATATAIMQLDERTHLWWQHSTHCGTVDPIGGSLACAVASLALLM